MARLWAAIAVLVLVGGGSAAASPQPVRSSSAVPCAGLAVRPITHVVLIVMENHDFSAIDGHSPYLNGLARNCGLETSYMNLTHPSLPNYMALTAGRTLFNGTDCLPHGCRTGAKSIFSQTGRYWRVYAESMPSNCFWYRRGEYVSRHTAAPYFARVAVACRHQDVPMGTAAGGNLSSDVASGNLPAFSLVIGNLLHDEHDGSVAQGDRWLSRVVPMILRGPQYRSGRVVVEITYDEGVHRLYTVMVAREIKPGTVVSKKANHYALLATNEDLLGLKRIGHAQNAPSLAHAFGLS